MRTHVLPLVVIALLSSGCGGGEFSGGAAGAPADDASVDPDGASGSGGKAGAGGGGTAGNGGTAGGAGAAGAGGAQDASAEAEAGLTCPSEQQFCGTLCVDTSSNPLHCGFCDNACPSNQVCQSGGCVSSCTGTTTDCGGACVDLKADLNNCGKCGVVCTAGVHQTPQCYGGQCGRECEEPWASCNGGDDGCEANLDTDPSTCGSCLNACTYPNAKPGCQDGVCLLESCNAGFGTCDGDVANGCETNVLTDVNNCGDCNAKCAPANATGSCNQGECQVAQCLPGFADCDGNDDNGCEINIGSSVFNCGTCGRACSSTNVEAMQCVNGLCLSSCDVGYGNCTTPSSALSDDGCETPANSQKHCGSCSNDCSAQGASPFACLTSGGIARCGCTSDAQCGGAGALCATGQCKCSGSGTASSCRPGEACKLHSGVMVCACNAGGPCGATQTCCSSVGCVDVTGDANHCGGCWRKCAPNFGCSAGKCACIGDASCNAGSAGTCIQGLCNCATKCAPGERCLPGGACG